MSDQMMSTLWIVGGILLVLLELATMSFILIFLGLSAIIIGLLTLGLGSDFLGLNYQLLLFSLLSVIGVLLFRGKVRGLLKGSIHQSSYQSSPDDIVAGENAAVWEEIIPGEKTGKVEWRGTLWLANASERLNKGTEVTIVKRDNLTVHVERRK